MIEQEYYTVDQVAEKLHISPRTVQGLCRTGKIGASQPGRRYLIPKESLDDYLNVRH